MRKIVQRLAATADQDSTAAPRPKEKPPKPLIPPEYIEWLLGRCCDVELMGLDLKHGLGVRLNHVYTPLATSARPEATAGKARRKK